MKVLLIGGTGFIGSFLLRDLLAQGHEVVVYHRGKSTNPLPEGVREILGDRAELGWHKMDFVRFLPDVVIDCILSSERQAKGVMEIFRGVTRRVVAVSSQDVYRAYGIAIGRESGPLQPVPLTEDSDVRTPLNPYPDAHLRSMRQVFPWIDSYYDKIPVERVVLGDEKLAGTVLRLPMDCCTLAPASRFWTMCWMTSPPTEESCWRCSAVSFGSDRVPPQPFPTTPTWLSPLAGRPGHRPHQTWSRMRRSRHYLGR